MLKANTPYNLYIDNKLVQEVEIFGAVGNIAIVELNNAPYNFNRDTGKGITSSRMELRVPHKADVGAIAVYTNNIAANVNNEKLNDAEFREYVGNTIQLIIDAL